VMLAFSTDQNPMQFRIRQDGDMMSVQRDVPGPGHQVHTSTIYIDHVFQQGKDLFITVTSDGQVGSIYLNGQLAGSRNRFGLTLRDFTGEMILGNSPLQYETWAGVLKGIALFDRQLTSAELSQHYQDWVHSGHLDPQRIEGIRALYSFKEQAGRTIRDLAGSNPDLYIPEYFVTVRQRFLAPPWEEYSRSWGYWGGVLKNIVGFVPLGFVFYATFLLRFTSGRAICATIIVGTLASLTIEIGQAYLPTRDSGMTDIMTNALGTAFGAMIYASRPVQTLLRKLGDLLYSHCHLNGSQRSATPKSAEEVGR
jgi:VanZ like protein/concanavalin A-like lectin/glucanase superfamily protein